MAIPLIALAALSAGSTLASSFSQAAAIKSQGIWESSQMKQNAKLMDFRAKEAERMGETTAQQRAMQIKKLQGRQRAVAAAQGVEVHDGSALDIQAETAGMGALDIATIRNNAWREAWGYKVEAGNLRSSAKMTSLSAKYKARTTLLTGGMKAATQFMSGFETSGGGGGSSGGSGGSSSSPMSSYGVNNSMWLG